MDTPKRAGNSPRAVDLIEGKKYAWCACGMSFNQPFCDGTHKSTGITPVVFTAEKSGEFHLCMCKASGKKPFCDSSHNS